MIFGLFSALGSIRGVTQAINLGFQFALTIYQEYKRAKRRDRLEGFAEEMKDLRKSLKDARAEETASELNDYFNAGESSDE